MAPIPIKDILISARQESHRMRHHFIGVEHLFIALLEIKSGLASRTLTDHGLSNEYVTDAIRRRVGKGSSKRLWAGVPNTPRTDLVISIAQEIALEDGRTNIVERDLLIAILEENDSVPVRVLRSLGVDSNTLREDARTREPGESATQPFVAIHMDPSIEGELSHDQLFILRKMFYGYSRLNIHTRLQGGYTDSALLVVTPRHFDGRDDAAIVVKIGASDVILDEAQRYERYVKGTLPPLTARLEDRPTAPDNSDLAGIKYTFLADNNGNTRDMRAAVHEWSSKKVGQWLRSHLYSEFGDNWWRQSKPFHFEVWREYDWLLPPMLTLKLRPDANSTTNSLVGTNIRRNQFDNFEYGDIVAVHNFTVQKVNRDKGSIRLGLGQNMNTTFAYQIEIENIDLEKDTYYRGEVVESIIGEVWETRDDQLFNQLRSLTPNFDINSESIKLKRSHVPNPIKFYAHLLDRTVEGSLSTIHGDLHVGNILIGPNDSALLIDFGHTRDGHTVFDWATLEISLISERLAPHVKSWDDAKRIAPYLIELHEMSTQSIAKLPDSIANGFTIVKALREIVQDCLARTGKWTEYHVALAMVSLRAMTWQTMNQPSRRLMYMLSAVAMNELKLGATANSTDSGDITDQTDFMTDE